MPGAELERELEWVERVAAFLTADGIPPIAGRILGWLMICDPPEQSAAEISVAIGASRASLTTNLRMLLTLQLLIRRTKPGERTAYYQVDEQAWITVVRRQIASLATFTSITADGLDLIGPDSSRATRILAAQRVFTWMTEVFQNAPPPPDTR
ncbi:hypothetical protein JOF53_008445 [Crossiella equi]|uniref:Transcriptional regulator n=1 Tax=Crossiella equi TaxID=130796 RepID=A0ABS5ASL8_9PSEU|nr:transcriptional regulator [Crossiella equi]MBP2479573.1 hypothetical protein [Crossiella equi]